MFKSASCVLGAWIALLSTAVASAPGTAMLPYQNTTISPQQRAANLVQRMTLEEKASQLVNPARAIPRLAVSAYDWWSEALHGVAVNGTTEFPEPIGLAATFDVPGIHEMATDIGVEGRISTPRPNAPATPISLRASISGLRTSISSAIHAGDAGKKHTVRIRFSALAWRWDS